MILILMGVSGCGKTTVGRLLAAKLGWAFFEGDDFHPPENVAKMKSGVPLTDEDRAGWLARLAALIREQLQTGRSAVLACSALKKRYRAELVPPDSDPALRGVPGANPGEVRFVYLRGSYELIRGRMLARTDHFMGPNMLESQFAALEEPGEPDDALIVPIDQTPDAIVEQIIQGVRDVRLQASDFRPKTPQTERSRRQDSSA